MSEVPLQARYVGLEASATPGQVDLLLVLSPALARAVTRELKPGQSMKDATPLLWVHAPAPAMEHRNVFFFVC